MNKLKLKIVTPERVVLEAEVDSITLPTQMGQITILPNHIPLAASIAPGEMVIRDNGTEKFLVASGGVLEVKPGNEIMVLADAAEVEDEIDEKRAEEARERARKVMTEQTLSDEEYAATAAALERSLARIRIAHKRKYRKIQPPIS
ncbi:MAG: ATP synthase F1 subunit epsilon [Candidatus Doudnabacteria bacterium RIFCSPHIGHO2_01_FULL_49_9]|uniref:ATP synthase epsilon chain n=1 Tax=Candidatus Doudnabacteria bacterium RIFCSPHIGHO2_01_FULL_49_9 TaxID=1817827 RepID=A0A1F5P254_9BACT|nr:MAG: ATP synthase F1 subunit epsilon [Candidatus Doudnabacteria bacterium RIFCSPHIGHO2_01_FULL_49_9]